MAGERSIPGRQCGLTLLEISISLVLIIAVFSMIQGGMLSVHKANERGESRLSVERRARDVLDAVCGELSRSSVASDPLSGDLRYDFSEVMHGNPVARFQLVEGARIVGGEVSNQWSSEIRIECDASGSVVRRQDGKTRSIGEGIERIEYAVDGASFSVRVIARGDPERGVPSATATRTVRPHN